MSSTVVEAHAAPVVDKPSSKKSKHEKGEHKSKKRHRETTDLPDGTERKHKKSKSHVSPDDVPAAPQSTTTPAATTVNGDGGDHKKEKRARKSKKALAPEDEVPGSSQQIVEAVEAAGAEEGHDNSSTEKKKSKKEKKRRDTQEETQQEQVSTQAPKHKKKDKKEKKRQKDGEATHPDPMAINSAAPRPAAKTSESQTAHAPPFFTQTVSQYLPLFPQGMAEPIEGYAEQQLRPLLHRYVPALRGVLLAYRNPRIGEAPGKGSLTEASGETDDGTALLESIDEYAVGFSWLTVEADLFCPRRGSWMEGSLSLQSEGFVGVICYGMFNASIEASRLPPGWKWVDLMSGSGSGSKDKKAKRQKEAQAAAEAKLPTPTPEPQDENENNDEGEEEDEDASEKNRVEENQNENQDADGGAGQAHSTGYWVDAAGAKVSGTLRFRIKNYEVGSIGDYGYLSIEGTMLDEQAERAKVAEEMEADRRRKLKHAGGAGGLRRPMKRLPEFSMTKFGEDEQDEDDILRPAKVKKPSGAGGAPE